MAIEKQDTTKMPQTKYYFCFTISLLITGYEGHGVRQTSKLWQDHFAEKEAG
jgi:hypothetical protein